MTDRARRRRRSGSRNSPRRRKWRKSVRQFLMVTAACLLAVGAIFALMNMSQSGGDGASSPSGSSE